MGCAEEPKPSVCLAQVQVVSTPAAHSACELQNCWELLSSRLLCSTWQVQQQKSSCTHTVGDLTVLSYFSPSAADSISLRATLSKNQTVGSLKKNKKNRNTSSEMLLQSGFVFFFFFFTTSSSKDEVTWCYFSACVVIVTTHKHLVCLPWSTVQTLNKVEQILVSDQVCKH